MLSVSGGAQEPSLDQAPLTTKDTAKLAPAGAVLDRIQSEVDGIAATTRLLEGSMASLPEAVKETNGAIAEAATWATKAGEISGGFSSTVQTIASIASTIETIARQTRLLA